MPFQYYQENCKETVMEEGNPSGRPLYNSADMLVVGALLKARGLLEFTLQRVSKASSTLSVNSNHTYVTLLIPKPT